MAEKRGNIREIMKVIIHIYRILEFLVALNLKMAAEENYRYITERKLKPKKYTSFSYFLKNFPFLENVVETSKLIRYPGW